MNPRRLILLVSILAAAAPVRSELLYSHAASPAGWRVFWFDSAAPGVALGAVSLHGVVEFYDNFSLEFDPGTAELYAFAQQSCQITCPPPPIDPLRIDLGNGETTFLDWPGFPAYGLFFQDSRIDPTTRELRLLGYGEANFRYSLDDLELHEDTDLSVGGYYAAVAHPPAGTAHGGETFAIRYTGFFSDVSLVRIGGIGGDPPASSGQVTDLGAIAGPATVTNFDISPLGTAFLLGPPEKGDPPHLWRLDLDTRVAEDLGELVPPSGSIYPGGLAAAPRGTGQGVVEVPMLSRAGAILLGVGLAALALGRLRRGWKSSCV